MMFRDGLIVLALSAVFGVPGATLAQEQGTIEPNMLAEKLTTKVLTDHVQAYLAAKPNNDDVKKFRDLGTVEFNVSAANGRLSLQVLTEDTANPATQQLIREVLLNATQFTTTTYPTGLLSNASQQQVIGDPAAAPPAGLTFQKKPEKQEPSYGPEIEELKKRVSALENQLNRAQDERAQLLQAVNALRDELSRRPTPEGSGSTGSSSNANQNNSAPATTTVSSPSNWAPYWPYNPYYGNGWPAPNVPVTSFGVGY